MQGIATIATALLVIASSAAGVRLVALHRRTRAAPELLLGGMLLLTVGVSYPLTIAAAHTSAAWAGILQVISSFAVGAGFSLLFAFTWRVFRPQAGWARALVAAGVLTLFARAAHAVVQVKRGTLDVTNAPLGDVLFQCAPVIVAYSWTAAESLRYHGLMRRRLRLGLADPVVSNRFLLWGLMACAADAGVLFSVAAFAMHMDALRNPAVLLLFSATGLAQVVFLVLALLPPRSYLSWLRARAAQGA